LRDDEERIGLNGKEKGIDGLSDRGLPREEEKGERGVG